MRYTIGWLCLLAIVLGSTFGFPLTGVSSTLSARYTSSTDQWLEHALSRPRNRGPRSRCLSNWVLFGLYKKVGDSLVRASYS
jgi:hypothetical protein